MNNYTIQFIVYILAVGSLIVLKLNASLIPNEVFWVSIIVIILIELFCIFQYWIKDGFKDYISKGFDYRMINVCLIYTYVIVFVLMDLGYLTSIDSLPSDFSSIDPSPPDLFWQAQTEFFITFGISLAIIGAIYSLLSKQRADDVFDKSEEIYKAITSFIISYEQLLDDDPKNNRSIQNVIKNSKKNLTFFLGSPAVGYFRDQSAGKKFVRSLEEKIGVEQTNTDFKVQFLCWSEEHSKKYYTKNSTEEQGFNNLNDSLKIEMRKLGTKINLYNWINGSDPGYRFIISDEKEVIYWVLVDTSWRQAKEEKEDKKIRVGGFHSEKREMVDLFQGNFKKTIENSDKVRRIDSASL